MGVSWEISSGLTFGRLRDVFGDAFGHVFGNALFVRMFWGWFRACVEECCLCGSLARLLLFLPDILCGGLWDIFGLYKSAFGFVAAISGLAGGGGAEECWFIFHSTRTCVIVGSYF